MYEKGWITYIRTDSTVLSSNAQNQVRDYLKEELNIKAVPRSYNKKKSEHAQEAHECIRPTLIKRLPSDIDSKYQRLYELIWNRTVASQMEPSESISVSIQVARSNVAKLKKPLYWTGSKSYCVKAGWKQIEGVEEVDSKAIPVPKKGSKWKPESIIVEEIVPNPPHRYSDATFVSQLEKIGIGRPSTYATIVETIQSRGYAETRDIEGDVAECRVQVHTPSQIKESVEKKKVGAERRRLCLTSLGSHVCEFLYPSSDNLLGIKATSIMESLLDEIDSGKKTYENVVESYWNKLNDILKIYSEQTKSLPKSSTGKGKDTEKDNILGTQILDGKKYTIGFEITRYGPAITRVL